MKGKIIIECDKCIDDIEIEVTGDTTKELLSTKRIDSELKKHGWHVLKSCLCPKCKEEVGDKNCMNCKHMGYKEFNNRCCREMKKEDGIMYLEGSIVSKYDTCKHFGRE